MLLILFFFFHRSKERGTSFSLIRHACTHYTHSHTRTHIRNAQTPPSAPSTHMHTLCYFTHTCARAHHTHAHTQRNSTDTLNFTHARVARNIINNNALMSWNIPHLFLAIIRKEQARRRRMSTTGCSRRILSRRRCFDRREIARSLSLLRPERSCERDHSESRYRGISASGSVVPQIH